MATKINTILFIVLFVFNSLQAQEKPVKVIEERKGSRYIFKLIDLQEKKEVKEALSKTLGKSLLHCLSHN